MSHCVRPVQPFLPYSFPVSPPSLPPCSLEGIVVAQESEPVLREAWEQEQQITLEKEAKVKCITPM